MQKPKPVSVRLDEPLWKRMKEFQKRIADATVRNVSMNDAIVELIDRGLTKSGL